MILIISTDLKSYKQIKSFNFYKHGLLREFLDRARKAKDQGGGTSVWGHRAFKQQTNTRQIGERP